MVQTRESRALASSLLDDELLVRDGVAKLYLCWTAWTLAQWYQCKRLQAADLRLNLAERIWQRLQLTTEGRGFGGPPAVEPKVKGINLGIQGILRDDTFDRLTLNFNGAGLEGFEARLKVLDADIVGKPDTALETLATSLVQSKTWARLNWIPDYGIGQAPRVNFDRDGPPDLAAFKQRAPTARTFWGASRSIERTSRKLVERGLPLSKYHDIPLDDNVYGSPVPLRVLIAWSRHLGFGPMINPMAGVDETAHAERALDGLAKETWQAFSGADADGFRGASCASFASCLQKLISQPLPGQQAGMRISVHTREKLGKLFPHPFETTTSAEASVQADGVPARDGAAAPSTRVRMNSRACNDDSNLRVDIRDDGRVVLEEFIFRFNESDEAGDVRVCLAAIEVEWNWEQSLLVRIHPRWRAMDTRLDALRTDNAVRVAAAHFDSARFIVRLGDDPGGDGAFAPHPNVALAKFVMPGADIVPAVGRWHVFRVMARKQDLCVARRGGDGKYRVQMRADQILGSETDTLSDLVSVALVEVAEALPADNSLHALVERKAEARADGDLPAMAAPA